MYVRKTSEDESESESESVIEIESESGMDDNSFETSSMIQLDTDLIKSRLLSCIDPISEPGIWATSCLLTSVVNPGLALMNESAMGLPLSTSDALRIKQQALTELQSNNQIHDTGYELRPDQFESCNPAWKQHIQIMAKQIADSIGTIVGEAKLEKLVLHGVGTDIKLDTEYFYSHLTYIMTTKSTYILG